MSHLSPQRLEPDADSGQYIYSHVGNSRRDPSRAHDLLYRVLQPWSHHCLDRSIPLSPWRSVSLRVDGIWSLTRQRDARPKSVHDLRWLHGRRCCADLFHNVSRMHHSHWSRLTHHSVPKPKTRLGRRLMSCIERESSRGTWRDTSLCGLWTRSSVPGMKYRSTRKRCSTGNDLSVDRHRPPDYWVVCRRLSRHYLDR